MLEDYEQIENIHGTGYHHVAKRDTSRVKTYRTVDEEVGEDEINTWLIYEVMKKKTFDSIPCKTTFYKVQFFKPFLSNIGIGRLTSCRVGGKKPPCLLDGLAYYTPLTLGTDAVNAVTYNRIFLL